MLLAARFDWRPRLLDYRNSGDTAGDRSRVVGTAPLPTPPCKPMLSQPLAIRFGRVYRHEKHILDL